MVKAGEGELFGWGSAANPEEAVEVDASSGGRLGMERVRHIDPGADAGGLGEAGNKRERE